jgi:hypothetical protein
MSFPSMNSCPAAITFLHFLNPLPLNFSPVPCIAHQRLRSRRLHEATQAEDIMRRRRIPSYEAARAGGRHVDGTSPAALKLHPRTPRRMRCNHAHSSRHAGSREKHSRVLQCSPSGIFTAGTTMRAYSRFLMMSSFVPIFVVKAAVSCARVSDTHTTAATHCLTFSILLVMLAVSFLFSLEA